MKRKIRDISEFQFKRALRRHGFDVPGFGMFGYMRLPIPGRHIEVSRHNGGPTFRGQLAYLIREKERALAELEAESAGT